MKRRGTSNSTADPRPNIYELELLIQALSLYPATIGLTPVPVNVRESWRGFRCVKKFGTPRDTSRGRGIEPGRLLVEPKIEERGDAMSTYGYGGKELASAFRGVRKNTIQVAEDIPETSYEFVAAPGARTVGHMLTHLAISTRIWEEIHKKRLMTLAGLNFLGLMEEFHAEEVKPRNKAEIVELLRTEGEQFAAWMETLTPEILAEMVTDNDGKTAKSRFERLLSVKEHEMHHRAQLMLIERQLGIVPHLTRQFQERLAQMKAAKA